MNHLKRHTPIIPNSLGKVRGIFGLQRGIPAKVSYRFDLAVEYSFEMAWKRGRGTERRIGALHPGSAYQCANGCFSGTDTSVVKPEK